MLGKNLTCPGIVSLLSLLPSVSKHRQVGKFANVSQCLSMSEILIDKLYP